MKTPCQHAIGVALAVISVVLAACGIERGTAPASGVPATASAVPLSCFSPEEAALMGQVNAMRTGAGKPALPADTRLVQAARQDAGQFAAQGVKNFEFGRKYGYAGTSFIGSADAGFQSAAEFWARAQKTGGTSVTDPLTKDSPFAPRHIGVGTMDQPDGTHTYALVLGTDPGPPVSTGSCDPTP